MLKNKPIATYCGLTIILSNRSRFDNARLLTASGGHCMTMFCLRPEFNANMCEVRLAEDKSPFLPETKCVLLCGEFAMHYWLPWTSNNTLNELRGSVFKLPGTNIHAIPTYFPQDAADLKAYEQEGNVNSKEYTGGEDYSENESEDEGAAKRHSKTKRGNYAFWMREDVRKAKVIITTGIPKKEYEPTYITAADSPTVVDALLSTKSSYLYFDMETDWEEQNMQCFSFSFNGRTIFNVPILDYTYQLSFHGWASIIRALALAISRNTIVSHNGACFDFFVLGHKYRIPVNKCYDTMVAHHRCWPDVEKSLGHSVSHLTWENFHKDEDSQGYRTREQMMDRLRYCGKDVYTMFLVHKAIEKFAKTIPGLQDSIDSAMDSIPAYLCTTFQGIRVDEEFRKKLLADNDAKMTQLLRIFDILIGPVGLAELESVVKNSKARSLASSPKKCVEYFHNMLGYPIVHRTDAGEPSLGKVPMYKLALKYENPVIDTILMWRSLQKESGTLGFNNWHGDRNTCFYTSSKVKTFRQSSTGIFKDLTSSRRKPKYGGNLQNIEKSMRQMYVTDVE